MRQASEESLGIKTPEGRARRLRLMDIGESEQRGVIEQARFPKVGRRHIRHDLECSSARIIRPGTCREVICHRAVHLWQEQEGMGDRHPRGSSLFGGANASGSQYPRADRFWSRTDCHPPSATVAVTDPLREPRSLERKTAPTSQSRCGNAVRGRHRRQFDNP